jgi:hypothetical protein
VIRDATFKNGFMHYGPRKYHTLFLIEVLSMEPATLQKLLEFVSAGGRIFCIEKYPEKSTGWKDATQRDQQVKDLVAKLQSYPDKFILLKKPEKDFIGWYKEVQEKYQIKPYVKITKPEPFVMQVRYQAGDTEILLFTNSHMDEAYTMDINVSKEMIGNRECWVWNPDNGERHHLTAKSGLYTLELGPADSKLLVFDSTKKSKTEPTLPPGGEGMKLSGAWKATLKHIDGTTKEISFDELKDLAEIPELQHFTGTITYRNNLSVTDKDNAVWLNLGKVHGISELTLNGRSLGIQWYGRRIYNIAQAVVVGDNAIEIKITTNMGNYMKTLTDNKVAQYWTNELRKNQPIQPLGMIGPVSALPAKTKQ